MKIQIEISARHVHLTQQDLERLFGEGAVLTSTRELSQPGQFVSEETVTLVGPRQKKEGVAILGPCRSQTQVEISRTDAFFFGVSAPIRLSGKIIGSGVITLVGPKGELAIKEGVIVAKRHIHLNLEQAKKWHLSQGQNVKVSIEGPRALIFDEVEIRIDENFELAMHLDTDEANAAGIEKGGQGTIII